MSRAERAAQFEREELWAARETEACIGAETVWYPDWLPRPTEPLPEVA